MSSPSPPSFSVIQAGHRWIKPDGTPETWFYRFILNIFNAAGSGTPPFLAEVSNLSILSTTRPGTDYDRKIADLTRLISSLPNPSGRIAALEARIASLEKQLHEAQSRRVDLNPLNNRVEQLTALVMGTR